MAEKDLKRSIPSAQPERRRSNPHLRLRAYEMLFHLNRGFSTVAKSLDWLERLPIFQRDKLRIYRNMSEEVRALTNTALVAMIGDTESQDALRFEKLRLKWERRPLPKVRGQRAGRGKKSGR